jgi:hypothetical protein
MPVLLFAGEATHRQYMGTVHGAFASGIREAHRLVEAFESAEAHATWALGVAAAAGSGSTSSAGAQQPSGLDSTLSSAPAFPFPGATGQYRG